MASNAVISGIDVAMSSLLFVCENATPASAISAMSAPSSLELPFTSLTSAPHTQRASRDPREKEALLQSLFSEIYLRDIVRRNGVLEQTHLMENAVYNELRARGYSVDVGVVPVSERDERGRSIRKQLEIGRAI